MPKGRDAVVELRKIEKVHGLSELYRLRKGRRGKAAGRARPIGGVRPQADFKDQVGMQTTIYNCKFKIILY